MAAPVIAGLSRVVLSFARSPTGKQFLKTLKSAGKSPAERKALLTEQVQKSFRDSPGIRQRLISLEQGATEELSLSQRLAKKRVKKHDFVQRTGYINKASKDRYQKALDEGTEAALTKGEQAQITKLIDKGKLKPNPMFAPKKAPLGERTRETQFDMFDEAKIIRTGAVKHKAEGAVSTTKASMLRKRIQDTDEQIEKLKAKLESAYDNKLSDDVKYNITQQLDKAMAKSDRLKNKLVTSAQQQTLFGADVRDEFSEKSAALAAASQRSLIEARAKAQAAELTKAGEERLIQQQAANIRSDIARDPSKLPKDVYRKPYNPQEYGFEGYNPRYKGAPRAGAETVYGKGKTGSVGYVSPSRSGTIGGKGQAELPEYTLEGGSAAAKANVPKTQGAAPAFAKELTGRQTRRSMEAITPADDILVGVPYKLNPKGKYTFAHPITGDVKTSTVARIGPDSPLANRAWERGRKKRGKGFLWPASRMEGLAKNRKNEVRWAGKYGERSPANSKYGLTIDEYSKLSLVQKHELSRRLDLAKAGGARVSKEATGYKIPPELTQTGMTKTGYTALLNKRKRGMLSPAEGETLEVAQGRVLERTTPPAGRRGRSSVDIIEDKVTLADGTSMETAAFSKLPDMEKLGLLNKSFAPAAPKGQGFKNLTKQQKRLDETKSPKEWWDTGAPDKPMDYTKSYRGETKAQMMGKMKRGELAFYKKALKLDGKEYANLKPTEIDAIYAYVKYAPQGSKKVLADIKNAASKVGEAPGRYLLNMLRESGILRATPNLTTPFKKGGPVDENWIQKVRSRIQKKGTEGVCTDEKYGSSSCPPGSKRYNLAKTFRSMNRKRA